MVASDRRFQVTMGAEPVQLSKPPGRKRHLSTGLVVFVIVAGLFAYLSYRPVRRLRPDPPKGYIEMRREWDSKRRAAEERVARAYWKAAMEKVQPKYPFGAALPDSPPPEFTIEDKGFPSGGFETAPATRSRYWKETREAWVLRETWEESYRWSLVWFYDVVVNFQQAVWRNVERVLQRFKT